MFFNPIESRPYFGVLIAKTLRELDNVGPVEAFCLSHCRFNQIAQLFWLSPGNLEKPFRKPIGFPACRTCSRNAYCEAREILYQSNSECDRDCPKFTDRQWGNLLVGAYESCERLRIEANVGMGDQSERDGIDPRI